MNTTWLTNTDKAGAEQFRQACRWVTFTGEPRATEKYSAEQLRDMGMVGVYTTSPEAAKLAAAGKGPR